MEDELFLSGIQNHEIDRFSGLLPKGIVVEKNVVYSISRGKNLLLDLYYRDKHPDKRRAAIIFVHGGGFRGGSKDIFATSAAYFACKYNVVSISINYRLSTEAIFPAAVTDVKRAIKWIRSVAEDYRIDTERIVIAGGSAGGHLAAFAATTNNASYDDGDSGLEQYSSAVALAVCFNPVLDFSGVSERSDKLQQIVQQFLGGTIEEIPERYREASPFYHVSENTSPILLLHGNNDQTVPFTQSVRLHEKLLSHGTAAELQIYEGVSHGWFNKSPHFYPVLQRAEQFLTDHLLF